MVILAQWIILIKYICNGKLIYSIVGENKFRFWQIFIEAPKELLILIIQSKTTMSTHKYSENNHSSIAQ